MRLVLYGWGHYHHNLAVQPFLSLEAGSMISPIAYLIKPLAIVLVSFLLLTRIAAGRRARYYDAAVAENSSFVPTTLTYSMLSRCVRFLSQGYVVPRMSCKMSVELTHDAFLKGPTIMVPRAAPRPEPGALSIVRGALTIFKTFQFGLNNNNLVRRLVNDQGLSHHQILDAFFLVTLPRYPTPSEWSRSNREPLNREVLQGADDWHGTLIKTLGFLFPAAIHRGAYDFLCGLSASR